jgi:copper(I)-binding protein
VIGDVWPLILAALATAGVSGITALHLDHGPAPLRALSCGAEWSADSGDAVPVSVSIDNDGDQDDRLIGASTPVAHCVSIQRTRLVDGRRQSLRLPDGLLIPAGATTLLQPGASHLALFGLRVDLEQGETFPLTLYFDRTGEVNLIVRVRRRVDAAGVAPLPPAAVGDLCISGASAQPAPAATPVG